VTVVEHVPTFVHWSAANAGYLATKARRGAHTLATPHGGWPSGPAQRPIDHAVSLERPS
jgi:hypothetical protein